MRKTAFSVAFLTVLSLTFGAQAGDDFSALLADLSFSDLPTLNEPLTVADSDAPKDLKPAPGLTMPTDVPVLEKVKPSKSVAAKVALQDPIAASEPESVDAQIDMEAAFALQDIESNTQPNSQSVGHIFHRDQGCDSACENVITCSPHVKPNLPSSTFHQYFRSNRCNTNVWDGYQQPCGPCQTHIQGRCDCSKNGNSSCSSGACSRGTCEPAGCVGCASGCDS